MEQTVGYLWSFVDESMIDGDGMRFMAVNEVGSDTNSLRLLGMHGSIQYAGGAGGFNESPCFTRC